MTTPMPESAAAGGATLRPERDQLVFAEQVTLSYGQTNTAVVGNAAIGTIFVWIFWDVVRHPLLVGWLGALLTVSVARYAAKYLFLRRVDDARIRCWGDVFVTLNLLAGGVWGYAFLAFIPLPDPIYTVVTVAWMVGISAVSLTAYTSYLKALFAFSAPVLVPGTVQLLVLGGRTNVGLGLALCVYCLVMLRSVLRINRSVVTAIATNFALEAEIAERKRTEAKLHALSVEDGLTALANRRRFDEVLETELRRAQRESTPLSLVLIDIDCFKAFNDRYGHPAGDRCLQEVAQLVKRTVQRAGDLAARYGGEELALVLPCTGPDAAQSIAERLREETLALGIPHAASVVAGAGCVTLSAGVAVAAPPAIPGPAELIRRADAALYAAKAGGRNRVVAAPAA